VVTCFRTSVDSERYAHAPCDVCRSRRQESLPVVDTRLEQRIEARLATLGLLGEAQKSGQFRSITAKWIAGKAASVGVEALIRLAASDAGLLSRPSFAVDRGYDLAFVDRGMGVQGIAIQMAQWRREGLELVYQCQCFIRHLLQSGLRQYAGFNPGSISGIKANCLTIEIVEIAALKELEAIRQVIEDCPEFWHCIFPSTILAPVIRPCPTSEFACHRDQDRSLLRAPYAGAHGRLCIVEAVIGMAVPLGRSIVAEAPKLRLHIIRLLEMGCDL